MIFLGIQLFPNAFKMTALSSNFAPLTSGCFAADNCCILDTQLEKLKLEADEPITWFFDEFEFHDPTLPAKMFQLVDHCHTIYLVNHRKLTELVQLIHDWNGLLFNPKAPTNHDATPSPARPDISFVLASAKKVFDDDHLTFFRWPDEPF